MLVKDIHKDPGYKIYTIYIGDLNYPNFLLHEKIYEVGFSADGRVFYAFDPFKGYRDPTSPHYLEGITFQEKLTLDEVIADIRRRGLGKINVEIANDPYLIKGNVKFAKDREFFKKRHSEMRETLYQIRDKLETEFEPSSVKVDSLERYLLVLKHKNGTEEYRPGKGYEELIADFNAEYQALTRVVQNNSTNVPELNPADNATNMASHILALTSIIPTVAVSLIETITSLNASLNGIEMQNNATAATPNTTGVAVNNTTDHEASRSNSSLWLVPVVCLATAGAVGTLVAVVKFVGWLTATSNATDSAIATNNNASQSNPSWAPAVTGRIRTFFGSVFDGWNNRVTESNEENSTVTVPMVRKASPLFNDENNREEIEMAPAPSNSSSL
jgi:hypothetical protein